MDIQILATVSNGFQILGVLWVLFFGSRTLFEAVKAKDVPSYTMRSPNPSGNYATSSRPRVARPPKPSDDYGFPVDDYESPYRPPVTRPSKTSSNYVYTHSETTPIPRRPNISSKYGMSLRQQPIVARPPDTSHYQAWQWTGVFILLVASIAWVAFKANVVQMGLLWYEVLIIGLIPSAIWITIDNGSPPRTIGHLCLGPLIAVAIHFLIYPFHLPVLLSALITFIAALVLLFGYILIID